MVEMDITGVQRGDRPVEMDVVSIERVINFTRLSLVVQESEGITVELKN